jgi:hypothetical protein
MALTFTGISSSRARLARLAVGLRAAAGGEVVARAVAKVADQVRAVVVAKLARHEETGAAAGATVTTTSGAMVQVHGMPPAQGKRWAGRSYVSLHGWWPFSRGMPPFVVKRASLIFARELVLALGVKADGTEAAEMVSEAEAAEAAKVEKKKTAITRRAERSYDKRVRAREDREGR